MREYLEAFVEPTIADFEKNPASVRHAFVACVVTFHSVDYFAHPRNSAPLRDLWKRQSEEFAIVDDVAHAFKHVKIGNPESPKLRAKEVLAVRGAFSSPGFSGFQVGRVTLKSDPSVNVLAVVKEAAAFVRRRLLRTPVKAFDQQYMEAQLKRAGSPGPKAIGIDEIATRKGHSYRIAVSDLVRRRPIWFGGEDRSEKSMGEFYTWLGPKKSSRIRLAVMDMWKPFRLSTGVHAPQAAILFDKFHVMRHLGEALDEVRKSEYRRLAGRDRRYITPCCRARRISRSTASGR